MPKSASRVCSVVGCGAPCQGRFCDKHKAEDPALDRRRKFDETRPSPRLRGYDGRHERWRRMILVRDPICKIAHFCRGTAASTVADHIVPIAAGGARFDLENGQGACKPCHDWKTATQDSRFAGARPAKVKAGRGLGP